MYRKGTSSILFLKDDNDGILRKNVGKKKEKKGRKKKIKKKEKVQ